MSLFAVIPAAGLSQRMGRPKLTLRLGSQPVLAHVVGALRAGGIDQVLVVVGPDATDLAEIARSAGAAVALLPRQTPDMRATIAAGLAWIEAHWRPAEQDAWLLVPADHPTVRPEIVRALIQARAANPRASIFVPTHEARRGHPTLIGWNHVAGLHALPANQGLNAYFRRHPLVTMELAWPTPEILWDLDTPADYERLLNLDFV